MRRLDAAALYEALNDQRIASTGNPAAVVPMGRIDSLRRALTGDGAIPLAGL